MDDPVLTSRVEALRNNLNVVRENLQSQGWATAHDPQGGRAELLSEAMWGGLNSTLILEINRHVTTLKHLETALAAAPDGDQAAVREAWNRYAKILGESNDLLRECLEIIGTLAIRTRNLDRHMLYVADELIQDCMMLTRGDPNYYLFVHGVGETISKTRARIIRLRFPEWTIWDLPLAAHELGRVAVAGILGVERDEEDPTLQTLTTFVAEQREALIAVDPELQKASQAGGAAADEAARAAAAEASRAAQGRVRILLADAIATYTMGPAYACSAIMLRLDPTVVAQRGQPSDRQRAHVILSMLRAMNEEAKLPKPYSDVILMLEAAWKDTADRSNPAGALAPPYAGYLEALVKSFLGKVTYLILNVTAGFPHGAGNDGWRKAQEWAGAWGEQWKKETKLVAPTEAGGKLRDVLNATWLCRLNNQGLPADTSRALQRELTAAAETLCKAIIEAKRAGPGSAGTRGGERRGQQP
jgi:hypothetical protein